MQKFVMFFYTGKSGLSSSFNHKTALERGFTVGSLLVLCPGNIRTPTREFMVD